MNNLVKHYLVFVIILSVVGGVFSYLSNQSSLQSEFVRVLSDNGETIDRAVIKQSANGAAYSIVSLFSFSLAISIFISVFVSRKLESALQADRENELKNLQNAINADVFDSLFKKLVPEEIFDAIKLDVIGNRIVRRNANWIYDFSERDDALTISLVQTIKYELHNVSHEPLSDAIHSVFDVHNEDGGLRRLQCRLDGKEVLAQEFDAERFSGDGARESQDISEGAVIIKETSRGVYSVQATVEIPPGRHIDVTQVYVTTYKNNYVNDGYFTKYPLIDATLTANFPPSYEFSIFQSTSAPMQETLREAGRSIYELSGGVLPHQGFVYTLRKKSKERD